MYKQSSVSCGSYVFEWWVPSWWNYLAKARRAPGVVFEVSRTYAIPT